ncbi:hypothetical protein MMC34_003854 [Xylographa carneopallida]|nr:hypothetical protein [Xylographa carneopallida]
MISSSRILSERENNISSPRTPSKNGCIDAINSPKNVIYRWPTTASSFESSQLQSSPFPVSSSSNKTSTYDASSPLSSSSEFLSNGCDQDEARFLGFSGEVGGYVNTSRCKVCTPSALSSLKRKRGVDTLSATVENPSYNIDISHRTLGFEDIEEDIEMPPAKRAKYHHKIEITSGSGAVEYHDPVCNVHAALDISLPVDDCKECRHVHSMLVLYWTLCQKFRKSMRKAHRFFDGKTRREWDKLRCKFVNHKLKREKAMTQVPASPPLQEGSSAQNSSVRRQGVQIDSSAHSICTQYRTLHEFRRKSSSYIPGKYADTSGSGFLNTCRPERQNLDEWKWPPLEPLRRVENTVRPCLKRRRESRPTSSAPLAAPLYQTARPLQKPNTSASPFDHKEDNEDKRPATSHQDI